MQTYQRQHGDQSGWTSVRDCPAFCWIWLLLAVLLGACASGASIRGSGVGTMSANGRYLLSADEKKQDCRRLRGRMQIRILQVRSARTRAPTTVTSRVMQKSLTPIYGGTRYGADTDADMRRDIAQLKAYNARLGELKCPTVDLERELNVPYKAN